VREFAVARQLLVEAAGAGRLRFEVADLRRWDSALIAFVQDLREAAQIAPQADRPQALDESDLPQAVRRLLLLASEAGATSSPATARRPASLLASIGRLVMAAGRDALAVAGLVGHLVLRSGAALTGRLRSRAGDITQLMSETGGRALGIVIIVNGLVGGILAFVGAVQLRRFGTQIFVADLVGIATAREMAAIMTAIVMAGRTGGAYAAQIATMQGNEEIDALRALGIPIYEYLVLPRILALVAMMPLLYAYACAAGILGGFVVSMAALDLSATAYLRETQAAVTFTHLLIGLTKSVAFGAVIAISGCHIGLKAGRSAAEVGRAATSAVVAGIIGIIALDAVFAICADALRI
jgi:phospholipid/cholesterol/gamma-HCH transport system permease protein